MVDRIDFANLDPVQLAHTASPAAVVEAIGRLQPGMQFEVEALDAAFLHWVSQRLRERATADAAEEQRTLADALHRAANTNAATLATFDTPYPARWQSFAALVEHRVETIEHQDVAEALQREHVRTILSILVARGSVASQDELLGLLQQGGIEMGKANLSRIMKLLTEVELVASAKVGQRKVLEPGANLPPELRRSTAPSATATAAAPAAARGQYRRLFANSGTEIPA